MKALIDRILKDGKCYPGGILKVDKFINHQMDPNLMKDIAVEFIRRFASTKVNKILTIEASGIAPAIMMGFLMNLPVVFAKKKNLTRLTTCLPRRSLRSLSSATTTWLSHAIIFAPMTMSYSSTISLLMATQQRVSSTSASSREPHSRAWDSLSIESLAIIESLENCEIKIKNA